MVASSSRPDPEALQERTDFSEQQQCAEALSSSSELSYPLPSPSGSQCADSSDSPASPVPSELTFSDPSSVDIDAFLGPEYHPSTPALLTYRIVGDNIDKNVKPRDMTSDHQTRSLHYFHSYAVRDRIDLSELSSKPPAPDLSQMNSDKLLPMVDDEKFLLENMAILMGRTLKKYMPFFTKFAVGLEQHILHEFYDQMSTKSEVVR